MIRVISLAALVLLPAVAVAQQWPDAATVNSRLGRGINLGNALEAPKEGDWGMRIEDEYLKAISDAGFSSVRVPVKWSAHAAKDAPYAIDPKFFERVDHVIRQCGTYRLHVVLNVHHYDEMDKDPDAHLPRLVAVWEQIARRYKNHPSSLVFEMLNEPHDKLIDQKWNDTIPPVLKVIRATNPNRAVVIGPPFWNGIWALPKLKLPADPNLIVTVHYYEPFKFTHQGASWAPPDVQKLSGIKWEGTAAELKELRAKFDQAAAWGAANSRPIYLGEFGAYEKADLDSRVRWTAAVVREAEARNFSWAYWEFGAGFGAYDRKAKAWRDPLLKALKPN